MKSTGIVRKVDELGRIVLPVECRRVMEIEDKDALEVFVEDNTIILKKYEPACIFCGESRDVVDVYKRQTSNTPRIMFLKESGTISGSCFTWTRARWRSWPTRWATASSGAR